MSINSYRTSEGHFKGTKETNLYYQAWENPQATGTIIITPGHGEHTDSYKRVIAALKNERWTIYVWDLRGHGHSDGLRGYAEEFEDYCKDYYEFLKIVLADPSVKKGPVVFLAHSMGCLVQTKTLLNHPELKPDAIVFSSPLFGIGVKVPAIKKIGAEWIRKVLPKVTMWNEVSNRDVTRDPEVIRELEQDPYRHDRICASVYLDFLQTFPIIQAKAGELRFKTLMQISDKDPVVSTSEALRFFEHLGSNEKDLKIYKEAKHEIYNDIVREQVFEDLRNFLRGVEKKNE
ncbi:MAG: alpha/beta hydrolase [Bdellovibrionaceae bacterium]|nr:alpha/beta hydrolase [Pseudobdellovibrionaceae bacterium]